MGRLDNKVAIIIGAGSGIGKTTAVLFAEEGAKTIAADVSGGEEQTSEELQARGFDAIAMYADTSKTDDVQALMEAAVKRYGRVDVLVNSASYRLETALLVDTAEDYFDNIISVNLRGVFLAMKYAIPVMLANGGGTIVNMASIAGLTGTPRAAAYSASKGGVIQLTKSAALEYARGNIRINAICPAVIATRRILEAPVAPEERQQWVDRVPMARMGKPKEVAAMALFLASEESSFVTGAVLPVDGGLLAQ